MPNWLWLAVVAMFVIDAVILAFVLRQKARGAGIDLGRLNVLSKHVHERVGDHLRANYSGSPADLPQALSGLMPVVEQMLRDEGHTLDAEIIQRLVATSVGAHKIASRREVEVAFETLEHGRTAAA